MLNLTLCHFDMGIYRPRNPQAGRNFRCVQDHFEQLEMHWPQRYASRYGFWRPYVTDVIYRYLECGDLHFGFARVKCQDCGHEYLLAYSCKRRHFCPSCHQKRVVEFGEWLCTQVLKIVPHRQWVFSFPKRLRIHFFQPTCRQKIHWMDRPRLSTDQKYILATAPHRLLDPIRNLLMADIFVEVIQYCCALNWPFSGAAARQAVDFMGGY